MNSLQICVFLFLFYYCISIKGSVFHHGIDFMAVTQTDGFIDKTMLLKQIFEEGSRLLLITAPRKFGKSTNLNMIKTFLSKKTSKIRFNKDTFMKLDVTKNNTRFFSDHYGKYPVVYANFKAIKTNSYQQALNVYKCAIHEAYLEHDYLQFSQKVQKENRRLCKSWCGEMSFLKMGEEDIMTALDSLVRIVKEDNYNKKIVVLIDGYDNVINNALFGVHDNSEFDNVVSLTSNLILSLIKDSYDDVQLAVITGISYIPSMGLSELNSLRRYYFLDDHPFGKFYGLTENEISSLYVKTDFIRHSKQRELVKTYYNGYLTKRGTHIYNTHSFLKYLETGKMIIHWDTSDYFSRVIEMIKYKEIAKIIDSLLNYKSVITNVQYNINTRYVRNLRNIFLQGNTNVYPDTDLLLSYFLEIGLLTYDTSFNSTYFYRGHCKVKIPNAEVHGIIFNHLKQYFNEECNLPQFLSVSYHEFKEDLHSVYNSTRGSCKLIVESFLQGVKFSGHKVMRNFTDNIEDSLYH